jgi:hypothetical protein
MMRKLSFYTIGPLALLVVVAVVAMSIDARSSTHRSSSPALGVPAAVATSSGSIGSPKQPGAGQTPYLPPTPVRDSSGRVIPRGTQTPPAGLEAVNPPVTEQAVRDYIGAHSGFGRVTSTSQPSVVSIEVLTEAELRDRVQTSTGWPDETLLYYVVVSGSFTHPGPPGYDSTPVSRCGLVINAQTGNLLVILAGDNL